MPRIRCCKDTKFICETLTKALIFLRLSILLLNFAATTREYITKPINK